jgi:2-polyprenyl-3-methyl-5-hydroxy-6-metoxy-1,4-benzoquinol methylase
MSPAIIKNQTAIGKVIRAYDTPLVISYCWVRFIILHQRFLDEIGQYLPHDGQVLDIGCGFGLFSLYYAMNYPALKIHGIDLNPVRIDMAKRAAKRLPLSNVTYEVGDVTKCSFPSKFDAAYMLDIIHHIPKETVLPLISSLHSRLNNHCRLIIKDVDTEPTYKRWFTFILDKVMDSKGTVSYWNRKHLTGLLQNRGFEVFCHSMVDLLPYPHVLYVCRKL